jgi:prepilin-type N-terminal cleavage/methylation domain-containing protein
MSTNVKTNTYRRSTEGFSLVELLVVIAVIAILAAIIFPVFSSVQEKARQGTVMSNYSRISKALAQYELDNNRPPSVLFAYGASGQTMNSVKSAFHSSNPPGLFPNYINDPAVFTDPDNTVTDLGALTAALPVNTVDATGAMTASTQTFFQADAADVSPLVTSSTAVDKNTLVPRYQSAWTAINSDPAAAPPGGLSPTLYGRQLAFWRNAPGETYVTATTYHVGKAGNKVLVLFKSGAAKALDTSLFLSKGGDTADISVNSNGVSKANFWQLTPNG